MSEPIKAYPKLGPRPVKHLRSDLAALPAELLTDDIDDPNKVHRTDPANARDEIIDDHNESLLSDNLLKLKGQWKHALTHHPAREEVLPLTQDLVDLRRILVTQNAFNRHAEDRSFRKTALGKKKVFHLWYPENDWYGYEIRTGNPPAPSSRPKHLRNLDLVIDLTNPFFPRMKELLSNAGAMAGLSNTNVVKIIDTPQRIE